MLVMANGSLHYIDDELYHHGVKGMKWGVRKKRDRVTVRQATKNAEKAYKDSLKNDKARSKNGERVTVRQAGINARQAYKDSLKNDKARSKQAATLNRQKEVKKISKQKAVVNAKKTITKDNAAKAVKKGASVAMGLLVAGVTAKHVIGGATAITKVAGSGVASAGRAVAKAFVYANGGSDMHWTDLLD